MRVPAGVATGGRRLIRPALSQECAKMDGITWTVLTAQHTLSGSEIPMACYAYPGAQHEGGLNERDDWKKVDGRRNETGISLSQRYGREVDPGRDKLERESAGCDR